MNLATTSTEVNILAAWYALSGQRLAERNFQRDWDALDSVTGSGCFMCTCRGVYPFRPSDGTCRIRTVIDHCHVTGWVRSSLCQRCNIEEGKQGNTREWNFYRYYAPGNGLLISYEKSQSPFATGVIDGSHVLRMPNPDDEDQWKVTRESHDHVLQTMRIPLGWAA